MELIADALLAAGAFGAAFYCHVLQRRLSRFNRLESGMGNAIAVLSAQVDDLRQTLAAARESARESTQGLSDLVGRSEAAATRLELLLSSLHDLPPERGPAPDDRGERRLRFVRNRNRLEAAE